jgi:hypothetical protein
MSSRTVNTAVVAALSATQRDALAAQQLERTPFVRFSFWPNANMRPDKQDAQFVGEVEVSTVRAAEMIAAALAAGKPSVKFFADCWFNTNPGVSESGKPRPTLSGRCRNVKEDRAAQAPDAQSNNIVAALTAAAGK